MSGLYSPINRAAELITRPKGTGAEYMAELQKKPGYKPAEAEDRDLQALMALPQMERAAFMEKLKGQANKFPLKMRELGEGQTHHEDYTLPGGENYREILLHTPMPEGQGFPGVSHHFGGTPNILASVMVKDRTTPEGKKMLHLEEIQSDWHQHGRDKGYVRPEQRQHIVDKLAREEPLTADEEILRKNLLANQVVPYGPHAKDWHELALKAMIQHAAENGYDQIAINHGKTLADRYSLSKQVDQIDYDNKDGKSYVIAYDHNDKPVINETIPHEKLPEYFGKEIANQIVSNPTGRVRDADLEVGGEGMKKFYDQMVPSFLNKFGKKHGVQVQQGGINTGENPHEVVMDYSDPKNIYAVRPEGSNQAVSRHFSMHDAYKAAEKLGQAPVHTFDITPAMREDILKNGIPRYDEGGIIHKAEGGSMQEPSIHQMRNALMGKPNVTSLSNLTSIGANEAPSMPVKTFIPPHGAQTNGSIPVGGVDENVMQPGQQMMPQQPQQPQQPGQPQAGAQPQQGQPQPPQGPQSNILSMTPQGQAMAAMRPAGMADGGGVSGGGSLNLNIPLSVGGGGGSGGGSGGASGSGSMGITTLGGMMDQGKPGASAAAPISGPNSAGGNPPVPTELPPPPSNEPQGSPGLASGLASLRAAASAPNASSTPGNVMLNPGVYGGMYGTSTATPSSNAPAPGNPNLDPNFLAGFLARQQALVNTTPASPPPEYDTHDLSPQLVSGMASGGVARFAKGGKEDKPLHYAPSPALMKAEIDAYADRMARQIEGTDNPNKKTQQQLTREQNLPLDIRAGGKKQKVPVLNMENFKGAYSVGVPGDPSRGGLTPVKKTSNRMGFEMPKAGEYLHAIGDTPLESPVPLYGGKDYGAYGHPEGWASDLSASAGLFNTVKKLAQEDPERIVLGHYHKMSPESLHHAMHMMDSVLAYHQPHKQPKEKIEALNHLMRNVATTTNKNDVPYPEFPGFENPNDVMLHGALNSGMRKKLIGLLGTEKNLPGGKQKLEDLYYAISHPELRNIETGAGGSSMLQFDPSRELRDTNSRHPTYGYDIPSKLIGKLKYPTPADILAPRSMHNARQEIAAIGKKVHPFNQAKMSIIREPIDEQYINQLGEYETAMRKRLGYKKGGGVKLHTDQDTMMLELTRKKKVK